MVARFAGAGDEEKVNRTVYQAFLTAILMSFGILAPVGYVAAPYLLDLVNAAPDVKAEALPFLRVMYAFSGGMLIFFMLGGALRSAGDARTPMILGIVMTVVQFLTLLPSTPTMYYMFFSILEISSTALIVWYALKWSRPADEVLPVEHRVHQTAAH